MVSSPALAPDVAIAPSAQPPPPPNEPPSPPPSPPAPEQMTGLAPDQAERPDYQLTSAGTSSFNRQPPLFDPLSYQASSAVTSRRVPVAAILIMSAFGAALLAALLL